MIIYFAPFVSRKMMVRLQTKLFTTRGQGPWAYTGFGEEQITPVFLEFFL